MDEELPKKIVLDNIKKVLDRGNPPLTNYQALFGLQNELFYLARIVRDCEINLSLSKNIPLNSFF